MLVYFAKHRLMKSNIVVGNEIFVTCFGVGSYAICWQGIVVKSVIALQVVFVSCGPNIGSNGECKLIVPVVKGQKVEVLYDPANPIQTAVINDFFQRTTAPWWPVIVGGIVFLVGFIMRKIMLRKAKELDARLNR